LRLSTGPDPLNAVTILDQTSSTGSRQFDSLAASVQRSAPVALTAENLYYIELIHKDESGSDHASVAWKVPEGNGQVAEARKILDVRFLSAFSGDLALQKRLAPGGPTSIQAGQEITFVVEIVNQGSGTAKDVTVIDNAPDGFAIHASESNWLSGYRYIRLVADSEAGNRGP
jgi:uncharacterized repeat protein (TIGR01451 family)